MCSRKADKPITDEEKELIWIMFMGPYDDDWRDEKGVVDNTDRTIANRLNVNHHQTQNFISFKLDKHIKKTIKKNADDNSEM